MLQLPWVVGVPGRLEKPEPVVEPSLRILAAGSIGGGRVHSVG